jgi:hypothetical protein
MTPSLTLTLLLIYLDELYQRQDRGVRTDPLCSQRERHAMTKAETLRLKFIKSV